MSEKDFEKLVSDAIAELPENIRKIINNIAITVERRPTPEQLKKTGLRRDDFLLGLYEGVPLTTWGRGFGMVLPDKITIFQDSIENFAQTSQDIKKMASEVVWHEVAHHFGFGEKEVRKLERRRKSR